MIKFKSNFPRLPSTSLDCAQGRRDGQRRQLLLLLLIFFLTPLITFGQLTVSGVVTSDGDLLIGATVLVQGTTSGTITDVNGQYTLDVPDGQSVLVFSYIGYETQEVPVNAQTEINIILNASISRLDEVVVIGYGAVRKRDLTGAVGSLNGEKFTDEVISNLAQALQGKMAGLQAVSQGGAPGGTMIVRVRGSNSVIGSNDPLYVVDGFPIITGNVGETNLLSTINPGDIESIEVLKDASATAIYGSRGSNGVLLITTKQGKPGRNKVEFESSVGFRNVEKTIDLMNSAQYLDIANERAFNDENPPFFSPSEVSTFSQINTDWQDVIFRDALVQNYALRFSGGNDQTRYLVSGNYLNEEGVIKGSDFDRGSLRVNLDRDISDRFKLSSRILLSRSVNNQIDEQLIMFSALEHAPFLTPFRADGSYTPAADLKDFPFSPSGGDNPLAVILEQLDRNKIDRVLANLSGSYELLDGLTFKVLLGADQLSTEGDFFNPRIVERGLPAGSGSKNFSSTSSLLTEGTVNYTTTLRENDHLSVTAGYTWQQEQYDRLSSSSSGFVTDDLQSDGLGAGEFFGPPKTNFSEWTLLSFLGRANYSLNEKYLFTVSGRRDGSSRFGQGNKWGFFPSAAVAWRLSEESFMENMRNLSDLKLRVSWGISGNQAISPYQSLQRFSDVSLSFGGTPTTGFAADNLGNPNLKWETTEEYNVGFELGLWNQRFSLSADYYVKNTDDLLALVNLAPTSGFTTTIQNIGSTRNKGVELNLATVLMRRGKLSWDASVNLSANRNTVTETAGGQDIVAPFAGFFSVNVVREGSPLSSFFGVQTDGLTGEGLFNYVDQDGDGNITGADRVILGSPYPDFTYGISTSLSYSNFSIRLNIQGVLGLQIHNENIYRFAASMHRGGNNIVENADQRWTQSNPDVNARFPRATSTLNQASSDYYLEDADYLRIGNLMINYNIPLASIGVSEIKSASIFFSGQNLLTLSGYSWYTPDISRWGSADLRVGIDGHAYPSARTLRFGFRLGL